MKKLFLLLVVIPVIWAAAAPIAHAETNKIYEACQTLGGDYEERRTDCDPDCKSTYICNFEEGWSRVCDDQGDCSLGQESGDSDDDYESHSSNSDQVDEECEVCLDLCEEACDAFRQSWRRDSCMSECKSRCNNVCD